MWADFVETPHEHNLYMECDENVLERNSLKGWLVGTEQDAIVLCISKLSGLKQSIANIQHISDFL